MHCRKVACRVGMIHGVTLQPADGDGLVIRTQDAGAFAQLLHGANARTGCAEQIGREYGVGRAFEIARGNFLDKAWNVDVRGARVGTGRVVAEEAAVGLD